MDPLTYSDHIAVLEALCAETGGPEGDGALVAAARAVVAALGQGSAAAATLRGRVERLAARLGGRRGEPDEQMLARAGLSYLVRAGVGPEASLPALRACAFVLALALHDPAGGPSVDDEPPPPLAGGDREQAEILLSELLSAGPQDAGGAGQDALLASVRAFCSDPPLDPGSPFARRLLHNAELLSAVLEDPVAEPAHRRRARAALEYLVLPDDAVPDGLGIAGYVDDAHVLDAAVFAIDPARQDWIRLVEAAAGASGPLSAARIERGGRQTLPCPAGLVEAALLSEPWETSGPLSRALFVPSSGSAPVLLAAACALEVPAGRIEHVVLAAPLRDACELVASVWLGDRPLGELVRLGIWRIGDPPLTGDLRLVLTPGLDDVRQLVTRHPHSVRTVLVDARAVVPAAPAVPPVRPMPPSPPLADLELVDAYVRETHAFPRLPAEAEAALSQQKLDGRARMSRGLARLREHAVSLPGLPDAPSDADYAALAGILASEVAQREERATGRGDAVAQGFEDIRDGLRAVDRAVDTLTRANLRLVLWVARRQPGAASQLLDMVQEGNLGLLRAARLYDHRKGARFATYAIPWIRQAISAFHTSQGRPIRIPESTVRVIRRVERARRELEARLSRQASRAEVAARAGLDSDAVRDAERLRAEVLAMPLSLDARAGPDSDRTLGDTLADSSAVAPVARLEQQQTAAEVHALLETLPPLEAEVLRLRFGIGSTSGVDGGLRYDEVAAHLGMHPGRIRQLELKAMTRLRRSRQAGRPRGDHRHAIDP